MKTSVAAPPPAPTPVDPGKASIDYIRAMSDPALQQQILDSETNYRPQYNALNLQDMNQYLMGVGGQPGALDQMQTAADRAAQVQAGVNTTQRTADIADVRNLGASAADAYKAANPDLWKQFGAAQAAGGSQNNYANLQQMLGQGVQGNNINFNPAQAQMGNATMAGQQQAVGQGQLGAQLYSQALGAGGLGQVGQSLQNRAQQLSQSTGQLTGDEIRNLQQSTRAAYAARGVDMGSGAVSAEALGRLTNERQRMMEDLQASSSLNQAGQAELGANRGFQMGVQSADLGRLFGNVSNQQQIELANQGASNQYGLANQGAANQFNLYNNQAGLATQEANRAYGAQQQQQMFQNQAMLGQLQQGQTAADRAYQLQLLQAQAGMSFDPMQSILGRSSGAVGQGQFQQQSAMGLTQALQGPQLFNPDTGINLALQNSSNLGNYQSSTYGARAAATGAIIGGAMQGLGSAVGCWVAREVYGADNIRWMLFREWMLNDSPAWFCKLYIKHGEKFALWVADKPRIKNLIRKFMDGRIEAKFGTIPNTA